MEKEPLISIILPIYNVEQYLQRCMDSLYVQTYKNLEFVVVDDESNEECANLCDMLRTQDSRVVVYHKKHGGISDARNYGIACAKGTYLTFVDPDDTVDVDYVRYLYDLITEYQVKMSICQHRVLFGNNTIEYGSDKPSEVINAENCIERMLYHDVIDTSCWGKLYHKSLFDNVDYPVGKYYEDIATTYKLFIKSEKIAVGYCSKYNYIQRKGSIVNKEFSAYKMDLLDMTDTMAEDISNMYPSLKKAAKRRQVYARFSTLNQMLYTEERQDDRDEIIAFIKNNKKDILSDPKAPKRDKYAIRLLSCGLKIYKAAWMNYDKRKRS